MSNRTQVSVFSSEDFDLKAIVYYDARKDQFEVDFGKNGLIIATESYPDHSLLYHEDAAENYVNGIKKIEGKMS
jgi:hypothetical protein